MTGSRLRAASIIVVSIALGGLTNLATSGFALARWRWWLSAGVVLAGAVWVALDARQQEEDRPVGKAPDGPTPPAEIVTRRPAELLAEAGRPWMLPRLDREPIDRPELTRRLASLLIDGVGDTLGLVTGIHGAGGFGKTTLAAQVCGRADLAEHFPGGLLWVTVGDRRDSAELAAAVNDLCELLTGRRPSFVDPEQAGYHFGGLLDTRPRTLLIVDDVWTADQLRPFVIGGRQATRIITTRLVNLLPDYVTTLRVDEMSTRESRELLLCELPGIPANVLDQLMQLTGRWPLLLSLANGALRRAHRQGVPMPEAAGQLAARLVADGPATLDLTVEKRRNHAVRAAIEASLALLSTTDRERYVELSIFARNAPIPMGTVKLYWAAAGLGAAEAERLCTELAELSLVESYRLDSQTIQIHDVIRAYLRHSWGAANLRTANQRLVAAARRLLPTGTADGADRPTPWWLLPPDSVYLWQHIAYHLAEGGQPADLARLVCDLRWVTAKAHEFGIAALESDLQRVSDGVGVTLRRELARCAHLLGPVEPRSAYPDILVSRLDGNPTLLRPVADFLATGEPRRRLRNRWPLPDDYPALLRVFTGHSSAVTCCAVSVDGSLLVTGSVDGTARLWDLGSGQERHLLTGHAGTVTGCAVAPDGGWVVTSSQDRTLRIWDAMTGAQIQVLRGHLSGVNDCAVAPDGSWIVSAGADRSVRIWDTRTGTQRAGLGGHRLSDHLERVSACAVSPDGSWLATGSYDGGISIWIAETGEQVDVLSGHKDRVNSCVISADGTRICSTSDDGTARVWDVPTGEETLLLAGHLGPVSDCAIGADGSWIVTTGWDRTVRVWDTGSGGLRSPLAGHGHRIDTCAVTGAGACLVTGGYDGAIRLWDLATLDGPDRGLASSPRHTDRVTGCAVSPDRRVLVTTSWDTTARVWDIATGDLQASFLAHPDKVTGCAVDGSGRWALTTGADHTARVWSLESGEQRAVLAGHLDAVNGGAFAPDGTFIVTVGDDETVRIWDLDGSPRAVLVGHTDRVTRCAIAPDSSWFATVGDDEVARLWRADGTSLAVLEGHRDRVTDCAVTPDGATVLTTGWDGTVRFWDAGSAGTRRVVETPGGRVTSCALSPDCAWLAVTGEDQCLRIWSLEENTWVSAMRVDGLLVETAWMSGADGVCAVGDGGVYLFGFGFDDAEPSR